jgi:aspartokinase
MRAFRGKGLAAKKALSELLSRYNIHIELGTSLKPNPCELIFAINKADTNRARKLLAELQIGIPASGFSVETELEKVSIIGDEISSATEVDAILKLTEAQIPISLVTRTNRRLSLFVPHEHKQRAVEILHANLCAVSIAA